MNRLENDLIHSGCNEPLVNALITHHVEFVEIENQCMPSFGQSGLEDHLCSPVSRLTSADSNIPSLKEI
jgi:hypothetical protein